MENLKRVGVREVRTNPAMAVKEPEIRGGILTIQ